MKSLNFFLGFANENTLKISPIDTSLNQNYEFILQTFVFSFYLLCMMSL